jgi:hypothetical protein
MISIIKFIFLFVTALILSQAFARDSVCHYMLLVASLWFFIILGIKMRNYENAKKTI